MTDTLEQQLRRELADEAAALAAPRFTGRDIVTRGRRVQRRRWTAVSAAAAAAVAAVVITPTLTRSERGSGKDVVAPVATPNVAPMTAASGKRAVALSLGADNVGGTNTIEYPNPAASTGPWSVILRRPDGSLGREGAVLTYPVEAPPGPTTAKVNGVDARGAHGHLWWPIGGKHARLRGELTQAELITIAEATEIIEGRPRVDTPPGFREVWSGLFTPPVSRDARYGSDELGEESLAGLVFTNVATGAEFEDNLYAQALRPPAEPRAVHGRPAVFSTYHGGNGVLAWETEPGTVAFVGWSGNAASEAQVAALLRLAHRAVLLDEDQWRATEPQVIEGN